MKRKYLSILSGPLIAGVVIGGSIFWLSRTSANNSASVEFVGRQRGVSASTTEKDPAVNNRVKRLSIIRVHTDCGVVTLPGAADTWDQVEDAIFVADGIADMQLANNQVGWSTGSN
jgi:hypothetical protein